MFWPRWLLLCIGVTACAQDPFEIQVFEYEPLPRGTFTYEAHTNYVAEAPAGSDGATALRERRFHFSSEVTAGITDQIRAGVVMLTAAGPGGDPLASGMQYAGFRVLPHFYAPRSWGLPVNLGLVAEFSFERPQFTEDTREVELRGIVEKHIGRLQMDGNLVFERALHGRGTRDGWGLEPSGRIGWQAWRRVTPSVEYYGALGPLDGFLPGRRQIHMIFPGADWKVGERLTWSLGVGFAATEAGSQVVLKSRFEFEFGRKSP